MTDEAPEQITAYNEQKRGYSYTASGFLPYFGPVEYIRADLHAARIAGLERALAEAQANHFITRGERDGAEDHAAETADELRDVRARAEAAEAQVAKLVEALTDHNDLLRSAMQIAKREGVEGQIASTNWDAYYNRVAVVLKRHHATANKARAALSAGKREKPNE